VQKSCGKHCRKKVCQLLLKYVVPCGRSSLLYPQIFHRKGHIVLSSHCCATFCGIPIFAARKIELRKCCSSMRCRCSELFSGVFASLLFLKTFVCILHIHDTLHFHAIQCDFSGVFSERKMLDKFRIGTSFCPCAFPCAWPCFL